MNNTVINGTPLQNSIKDSEEYFITPNLDLLPRANIIPIGKQKISEKNETINVRESPPQAPVSTHSKPNSPPEIK